jgi:hypothetical protein
MDKSAWTQGKGIDKDVCRSNKRMDKSDWIASKSLLVFATQII